MNLPAGVQKLLPHERYRATLVLIVGGFVGYLSPPLVQAFTDRWQFPIEQAQVEQLREDVRSVPCAESQQILARVVEENILIARKHTENRIWYTDPFVTDRWNAIELIQMPCGEVQ